MFQAISTQEQEKFFNDVLTKIENKECADCRSKNPNWCAIDLGVFICYNCSGLNNFIIFFKYYENKI